jgi:hypothetical protein
MRNDEPQGSHRNRAQDTMTQLIEHLRRFNRKERNWLIPDALGSGSESLCQTFKDRVAAEVQKHDPSFAWREPLWWGTDYHLNWIVALTCLDEAKMLEPGDVQPNDLGLITGSQQDIDFLIASNDRLILIEAKGEGDWYGGDFERKIARLKHLSDHRFGNEGTFAQIRIHFLLCSPGETPDLDASDWPAWMRDGQTPRFVSLTVPPISGTYVKVERCNQKAKRNAIGGHWHIIPSRPS